MTKSIDDIWQQGFTGEMALTAPELNDLYNQKSNDLIARFEAAFATNHKAIQWGSVIALLVIAFMGAPILGGIICIMLNGLVYLGKGQLKSLQTIDKGQSCLQYLTDFDHWLDSAIAQYVKIYQLFYPTVFALCALRFSSSEFATEQLMAMELLTANGQPESMVYLIIAAITVVIGLLGGVIYRADLNIVYGAEIKKLKALISELKQLEQQAD